MAAGTSAKQRRGAGDKAEKEPATPPSSSRKNKKGGGPPIWLMVFGGFALLVVLGSLFGDGESKAKASTGTAKKSGGTSTSKTMEFLQIGLRLQEMTTIATNIMASSEKLDKEATKILDDELNDIDAQLEGEEDSTARDLRAMVSVVRGTLYQQSDDLTDEQVEKMNNAFTYANPRYWDDYYNKTGDELYDWYGSWDSDIDELTFKPATTGQEVTAKRIGDLLKPFFDTKANILMFGCGNSDMSEKMYQDGYQTITNIDISEKLLENLRTRLQATHPKMRWLYANASALQFDDSAFDVTIDKGTLDAIEQNVPLREAAVKEAHRTLRPGGWFLSITFKDAKGRVENQLRPYADWGDCHTHKFERPEARGSAKHEKVYYLHVCQRKP